MIKTKLTQDQWETLNAHLQYIPDPNESWSLTGVHLLLTKMLNDFGYCPHGKAETLEIAKELWNAYF